MSQQINLYNPLFLKKEKLFSARTMAQALGLIAVGLVGLYAYARVETRSTDELAAQYRAQVALQRQQFVELAPKLVPRERSKVLEADLARLDIEVKTRQATLDALSTGELGNATGFSEFLAALGRQAHPGVWLTAITIGDSGNELEVHGRMLRPELLPPYLRKLNSEPVMRGRRVTEMQLVAKDEPERYVEFRFTAPLRIGDAVPAAAAKGASK